MAIALITRADIEKVTALQLAACYRQIDSADGKVYYEVVSAHSALLYEVRHTEEGYTCTCPAGDPPTDEEGILLWQPQLCWHVRAAIAHAKLFRAEAARRNRYQHLLDMGLTHDEATAALAANLQVNGAPADDATLARVFGRGRPSEEEMERMARGYQTKGFRLLR